jgi:glyoxylase-like metal-dependent hydrolase (beta-lactamase superfamily II)
MLLSPYRCAIRSKEESMPRLALAVLLFLSSLAFAQRDFSAVQIKPTRITGNLYLLESAGGNMAALVGEDGTLLVDTDEPPMAEKLKAALKGLSDKHTRLVVLTHFHGDHIGANGLLSESALIVAHESVRKRLQNGGISGNSGSIHFQVKLEPKAALPAFTFDHKTTVHLNGEDVEILHTPAAHTEGDSILYFRNARVVHMGDVFIRYGFPFTDVNSGGSVQGMITALENAMTQLPPDVKIIPGHGQVSTMDDVRDFVKMLRETSAVVQQGIKSGKTLDQLKQEKVLAPWKKWSNDFISSDAFLETLYASLSRSRNTGAGTTGI